MAARADPIDLFTVNQTLADYRNAQTLLLGSSQRIQQARRVIRAYKIEHPGEPIRPDLRLTLRSERKIQRDIEDDISFLEGVWRDRIGIKFPIDQASEEYPQGIPEAPTPEHKFDSETGHWRLPNET